jgi:6-phosphogluconolactonase
VRRLLIRPDAAALTVSAAEEFARAVETSVGPFRVALSGGETPKAMFRVLAAEPFRSRVSWHRIRFFWGDERCVPPEHPDSNYRAAYESLLSRVPAGGIFRIPAELPDPDEAARRYEETLRRELERFPLDLAWLGLGPDGHTASLFPGTAAVAEKEKWAAAVWVEEKKSHRITMTLPVLNAAKKVIFLVEGEAKAEMVPRVIEDPPGEDRPASLVQPADGEILWMLDEAAAARLSDRS